MLLSARPGRSRLASRFAFPNFCRDRYASPKFQRAPSNFSVKMKNLIMVIIKSRGASTLQRWDYPIKFKSQDIISLSGITEYLNTDTLYYQLTRLFTTSSLKKLRDPLKEFKAQKFNPNSFSTLPVLSLWAEFMIVFIKYPPLEIKWNETKLLNPPANQSSFRSRPFKLWHHCKMIVTIHSVVTMDWNMNYLPDGNEIFINQENQLNLIHTLSSRPGTT